MRRLHATTETALADQYWSEGHTNVLRSIRRGDNPETTTAIRSDLRRLGLVEGDEWRLKLTQAGEDFAYDLFY